jgi:hypothetical protein
MGAEAHAADLSSNEPRCMRRARNRSTLAEAARASAHGSAALVARAIGGGMSFAATPNRPSPRPRREPYAVRHQHERWWCGTGFDPMRHRTVGPAASRRQALAAALALVDEEASMLATAAAWRQVLMAAQRTSWWPRPDLARARSSLAAVGQAVAHRREDGRPRAHHSKLNACSPGWAGQAEPLPLPAAGDLDARRHAALPRRSGGPVVPSSLGNLLAFPSASSSRLAYLRAEPRSCRRTTACTARSTIASPGALQTWRARLDLADRIADRGSSGLDRGSAPLLGMASSTRRLAQLREAWSALDPPRRGLPVTAAREGDASGGLGLFGQLDLLLGTRTATSSSI